MKVEYHERFDRDLAKVRDLGLARQVKKLIMRLETATALTEIPNVKKLSGGANFFRARLGDYRVGLVVSGGTVVLMRIMHRRDIYRFFP